MGDWADDMTKAMHENPEEFGMVLDEEGYAVERLKEEIKEKGHATTTMGDLIDIFIHNWVVISYQDGLDKPEVIGPFNSEKEAQIWSSEHFNSKDEIKHQITWLVEPTK